MGLRLNKNIFRIIYAYIVGSIRQYKYNKTLILKQNKIMRSNRLKILIVSHPYIVYDKYLSSNIINYYKDVVDGIIFLSAFPCGTDSLVNELAIRKLKNIPCINIILDDSTSTLGLYTRLESFVDIIKVRHNNG